MYRIQIFWKFLIIVFIDGEGVFSSLYDNTFLNKGFVIFNVQARKKIPILELKQLKNFLIILPMGLKMIIFTSRIFSFE
tara:strand:+ start:424 stop:660 length:237 start_codon:yes stop_codon:yes gene_type:complete